MWNVLHTSTHFIAKSGILLSLEHMLSYLHSGSDQSELSLVTGNFTNTEVVAGGATSLWQKNICNWKWVELDFEICHMHWKTETEQAVLNRLSWKVRNPNVGLYKVWDSTVTFVVKFCYCVECSLTDFVCCVSCFYFEMYLNVHSFLK
jgi:hypothetical protein